MVIARYGHTATLLNNGQVLIAGGGPSFLSLTRSTELYDPIRGTFTLTGNMIMPRIFHTATLLPDGRVLITGGDDVGAPGENIGRALFTAEIYDPSTGTFTATGEMIHGRECGSAHLLNNGKVLLYGGYYYSPEGVPNAELYDPTTGSFAAAGTYATVPPYPGSICAGNASTLLADGRLLIVWEDDLAEIYDPVTGSFTQTGKPLRPMFNVGIATGTLLMDGKVLKAGGEAENQEIRFEELAEMFDVVSGSFTPARPMTAYHDSASATLLPDGTVLLAGGSVNLPTLSGTDVFDPVSGIFRAGPELVTNRISHTATLLNDGRVLIAGGLLSVGPSESTALAELYTPSALTPAPILLSLSGNGQAQGAILHAGTVRLVTPSDPAAAGEALEIYCTGLAEGSVIPPRVAIGGRLAEILHFGKAPGFSGLNQVNVRVPGGVTPGPAVSVRLNYLGRPTNEVTIGVGQP